VKKALKVLAIVLISAILFSNSLTSLASDLPDLTWIEQKSVDDSNPYAGRSVRFHTPSSVTVKIDSYEYSLDGKTWTDLPGPAGGELIVNESKLIFIRYISDGTPSRPTSVYVELVPSKDLTESQLGIKAKLPGEASLGNIRLGAYEIAAGVDYNQAKQLMSNYVFKLINIMFLDGKNEIGSLSKPANILLPVPKDFNAGTCIIYKISAGKAVEVFSAVSGSDLSFSATGSGLYIIADPILLGDLNFNGKVQAEDARLVLRYVAKLDSLTPKQLQVADMDGDGKVSASDARIILRIAAKLQ
jgi:hypothetical protein